MSNWVHRTMIVPAARVAETRALASAATPAGAGMWTTPLAPPGQTRATHWISAGLIDPEFAAVMDSPEVLAAATGLTLARARNMLAACHVSDRDPWEVMAELNLTIIEP